MNSVVEVVVEVEVDVLLDVVEVVVLLEGVVVDEDVVEPNVVVDEVCC